MSGGKAGHSRKLFDSIYDIMARCALSEEDEKELKEYTESLGMEFLSTPFSRAAAERLERMGVKAYKIGSGELNNYPLVEHIAEYGKPMIVSTGMNDIKSVAKSSEHYGEVWCSVCVDAHDKFVSDQTGVGSSRCDAGDDERVPGCADWII